MFLLLGASVFLFLFLFLFLLFIPVFVVFQYQRIGEHDELMVKFRFLGVVLLSFRITVLDTVWEVFPEKIRALFNLHGPFGASVTEETEAASSSFMQRAQQVTRTLRRFQWVFGLIYVFLKGEPVPDGTLGNLPPWGLTTTAAIALGRHCCRFEWNTRIGTTDAAYTAVASGLLWGIKGGFLALVQPYVHFRQVPEIAVVPDFNRTGVDTSLYCIFRVYVGHIMIVGVRNLARVGIGKGVKALGQ